MIRSTPILALALCLSGLASAPAVAAQNQPGPASPCPNAIKINTNYHFRNALHFICLQASPSGLPRLEVIHYSTRKVLFSREVEDYGTNQLASFLDDEGILRILLAVPTKINGTSMYSLHPNELDTREKHTINTQYVTTMSIWRLELNNVWQLAIANEPHYDTSAYRHPADLSARHPPKTMLTIHFWRASYFDSYQMIELPMDGRVNRIEPINIFGQEFLVVATEPHRLPGATYPAPPANSQIYKLDFSEGTLRWQPYQTIRTSLAKDARAFMITHQGSLQRDHYIAVLGQISRKEVPSYITLGQHQEPGLAYDHGLLIFKFMGDQFMLTNLISTPGATKLDAISYGQGDSYVLIALTSDYNQLNLYLFDGLSLKLMPSPFANINRQPGGRARREYDQTELHLFRVPPSDFKAQENSSSDTSSYQRRTMLAEEPSLPNFSLNLPALAFSNPRAAQQAVVGKPNDSQTNKQFENVYKIPIEEMISENERQLQSQSPEAEEAARKEAAAGRKRAFVGTTSSQELLNWCRNTLSSLLSDSFNDVTKQIVALPKIDQRRPIELDGDLIIDSDLHISNLLYANNVRESVNLTNNLLLPQTDFSRTFGRIQEVHNEIDNVARQVDQILVDDGSQQDVFEPLSFETVFVECPKRINIVNGIIEEQHDYGCPYVNEINTQLLNSRNISKIQEQALLTGRSMIITSDVRFEHLVLRGSVDILSTLNGLSIDDLVFKAGPSRGAVVGEKNFQSGLYTSANLRVDRWNGFEINRQNYLLSTGEQRMEANIRLNQVIIDTPQLVSASSLSSRIERLNGIHLDMHLSAIAVADDPENIFQVPVYFDELHLNGPIYFKTTSLLSSINLDELWATTMFKHSNQNISGPINFAGSVHVGFGGDVLVRGLLNQTPFNSSNILLRNINYKLSNPLIVDGNVWVNNLILHKALNGIQVLDSSESWRTNPTFGELSILYNGGNQMITADKVFHDIHLGGESAISGNINGHLNLSELFQLANNDGPLRIPLYRITGRDVRVSGTVKIHVDNSINGIPVNELCSLATNVSRTPPANYNRLRFEGPLQFKSLQCNSVNGFTNLAESFLTRHGNQRIAGTLSLTGGVVFNTTINVHSSLNNMNIGPLARGIAQTLNDTRTGRRDFYGDLVLDDLITDRINDLLLHNVFLARSDTPQIVRSKMVFDHLDIENVLIVNRNLLLNSFNGINITDLVFNSMQYDAPQEIYSHIEVNTLHLMPGENLATRTLNGFELQRLYSDAVVVDSYQQIPASKIFRAPVEFTNRTFFHLGLDGLSKEELRNIMLLHSDELIQGDIEFNNDVYVRKELEILSNIINDMDVNLFFDSILYETKLRDQNRGMRIFGNGSVSFNDVRLNNLVVAGTVQGLDVSKEALLRNENLNGSLNDRIREQQFAYNNQRFLNLYGGQARQQNFRVFSQYRGQNHTGTCQVHSCSKTSIQPPVIQPMPPSMQYLPAPGALRVPYPPAQQQPYYPLRFAHRPVPVQVAPPQLYYPPVLPAMPLLNWNKPADGRFVWQPARPQLLLKPQNQTIQQRPNYPATIDSRYLEYMNMMQAQAISDLAHKVNKYLSVSFYYEIFQKHPDLGPILNVAVNPVNQMQVELLLKTTGNNGEPCLKKNQKIAVMTPQANFKDSFSQSGSVTETSNPVAVETLVLHHNIHFLVVLEEGLELNSQIVVYIWDNQISRYAIREVITLDGHPTTMRVFSWDNGRMGCIALAMPMQTQNNFTGGPNIYCQTSPMSNFSKRIVLKIKEVYMLDLELTAPTGSQLILASLSQRKNEQMGSLNVHTLDIATGELVYLASSRLSSPRHLHIFRRGLRKLQPMQFVVAEAITSNDHMEATTRIFSLVSLPGGYPINNVTPKTVSLQETQIIRDSEFSDIQTVHLDEFNSLLFLQADNFIHIYGPILQTNQAADCGPQYSLVQRLHTKGANRFLVYNEMQAGHLTGSYNSTSLQPVQMRPLKHFLILTKESCEERNYWTVFLKAKFS